MLDLRRRQGLRENRGCGGGGKRLDKSTRERLPQPVPFPRSGMRAWTSPELFGASTLCLSEASGSLRPSIELFSFSKRASVLSICAFIECCTESEFIEGLTQDL